MTNDGATLANGCGVPESQCSAAIGAVSRSTTSRGAWRCARPWRRPRADHAEDLVAAADVGDEVVVGPGVAGHRHAREEIRGDAALPAGYQAGFRIQAQVGGQRADHVEGQVDHVRALARRFQVRVQRRSRDPRAEGAEHVVDHRVVGLRHDQRRQPAVALADLAQEELVDPLEQAGAVVAVDHHRRPQVEEARRAADEVLRAQDANDPFALRVGRQYQVVVGLEDIRLVAEVLQHVELRHSLLQVGDYLALEALGELPFAAGVVEVEGVFLRIAGHGRGSPEEGAEGRRTNWRSVASGASSAIRMYAPRAQSSLRSVAPSNGSPELRVDSA